MNKAATAGQRVAAVDGLRGIAVLLVLICHLGPLRTDFAWLTALQAWFPHARLGVDVFFVLSGFLISQILLASKQRPGYFSSFYLRRFLRIVPAYIAVLVMSGIGLLLLKPQTFFRDFLPHVPEHLLFVQNWAPVLSDTHRQWYGINHLWSLAVEEQFYVIWPLLLLLTPARRLRDMCVFIIVAALMIKGALWALDVGYFKVYALTFARMDGFAAGALIATLRPDECARAAAFARRCAAAGLALLLMLITTQPAETLQAFFYTTLLVNLVVACSLLLVVSGGLPKAARGFLEWRALCWVGFYSYGIYLLHYPLLNLALRPLVRKLEALALLDTSANVLLAALLCYLATFVGARLMYAWIEKPALDLRRRTKPEPAPVSAEGAESGMLRTSAQGF